MKVGLLERFVNGRKNTLPENIIVCIATALAGTFYFYEYYYGEKVHTFACLFITVSITATWLICSVCSGRDGKLGFMIFAFLYWSIPYIYILWYDTRDNLHDYNKWLAMSNKAARAMLLNPFDEAAKKLGTSPINLASILLIFVMGMYIAGFLFKRTYEVKRASENEVIYQEYEGEYVIDEEDNEDNDGNTL